MAARKVFVIGDALFADMLGSALAGAGAIQLVGSAPTPEDALPRLQAAAPDLVIVAVGLDQCAQAFGLLLGAHPDLPVMRADPASRHVYLIQSRRLSPHTADLVAVLATLPERS